MLKFTLPFSLVLPHVFRILCVRRANTLLREG
jgi:hypothetical protein